MFERRWIITGLLLPIVLASSTAFAEKVTECPSLSVNEEAADHWSFRMDENEWMPTVALQGVTPIDGEPIEFLVESDGPVDWLVLDWFFPKLYKGRIGILHYYSGAAGTHASANFTRVAIIDLLKNKLVANPLFSAEASGARYLEQDDGTTIETVYYHCDVGKFEWRPDEITFVYDDEISVYKLSGLNLY